MSAVAKDEAPIEAPREPSGQTPDRSEYRTHVLKSEKPHREPSPKKQRRPGQIIWVQRIEAEPKDWFQCKVTDVSEDPITQKAKYRVELVDGGAPGTLFEEGKWLQPDRLRDENDRKRPYNHEAQTSMQA